MNTKLKGLWLAPALLMIGCAAAGPDDGQAPGADLEGTEVQTVDSSFDHVVIEKPIASPYPALYNGGQTATRGIDEVPGYVVTAVKPTVTGGLNITVQGSAHCAADNPGYPLISCGMVVIRQTSAQARTTCDLDSDCGAVGVGYCAHKGDPTMSAGKTCFTKFGAGSISTSPTVHNVNVATQAVTGAYFFTLAQLSRRTINVNGVPKSACAVVPNNQNDDDCIRVVSPR